MATWSSDELTKIGNADELELASRRPDGTLRNPVTIWVVRDGDNLYVRSVKGPTGPWFRGTRQQREGRIHSGGVDKDVTFTDADPAVDERLDAVYRSKYRRYDADYLDPLLTPQARAATTHLVPR